jgi:hypothetical protein
MAGAAGNQSRLKAYGLTTDDLRLPIDEFKSKTEDRKSLYIAQICVIRSGSLPDIDGLRLRLRRRPEPAEGMTSAQG